ncbi:MAG: hypothetical protein JSV52_00500 [Candidatus Zixiibacteriota bacterium]|nr:MAG: hypothetical protein JSV52_00500 [candidate division Zixibacteria bacterium]
MIKVLDHFWLKITALALGLLLWFHVATEKTYNYRLQLPVEEVVLDEGLALSESPPESLTVTVSATGKQLLRQKWRDRGLKIIASQLRQGERQLPLNTSNTFLISPSPDVSLDEVVSPSSVTFKIDRLARTTVHVIPDIIFEPDEGFAVAGMSKTTPTEVTLSGPRSVISSINAVFTVNKELVGLRNSLDLSLPLALPDGYGVSLEPDSVMVAVRVVPVKTRVFENVPVVIYNSPPNQTVVADPAAIRIELTGPPQEIDLLNINALIASTDFSKSNEAGRSALKIDCPTKFRVKNSSADSVTLTIQ